MPEPGIAARVLFISHTSVDYPYATALNGAIRALAGPQAIDVRYSSSAEAGPQGGETWRDWIDERIQDFWSALIVVTPESVGKPWLLWEAGACHAANLRDRAAGQARGPRKIVPLAFGLAREECPDPLLRDQIVDGLDAEDMEQVFIDLLAHHGITRLATIKAAHEMRGTLETYLDAARAALLRMPSLVNEANIREWLDRLDRLGRERGSELHGFERWMNLAFGREGETAGLPIDVRLHRRLGEMYLGRREFERAMVQLNLARLAAPRDIYVLRPLGEAGMKRYLELDEHGDPDAATRLRRQVDGALNAIAELDEDAFVSNSDAAALRGKYQRLALRDVDGAIATFSAALERNPDSYYLADVLGQAQLEAGHVEDAKATYDRAVEILDRLAAAGESNVWTHATYATAFLVRGDAPSAARSLSAIAELDDLPPTVVDSVALGIRTIVERLGLDSYSADELVDLLHAKGRHDTAAERASGA
jgi:tetratricopeptide (TPR) repeat protein